MDCRLHDAYSGGDHTIFTGEMVAGDVAVVECADEIRPLLYFDRGWRQLTVS
ncbi:MAG: flavin reductase family protein [Caldilineaceae bacterium]|nr:flavin reductase family protein [Caldilineaceae bacterium]